MSKFSKNDIESLLPSLTIKTPSASYNGTPSNNWTSVIDTIYAQQHSDFMSRLTSPIDSKSPVLEKFQKVPVFSYPDPHTKLFAKEDGFFNPTALYLSRKPLTFNRNYRKQSHTENKTIDIPSSADKKLRKKFKSTSTKPLSTSQNPDPLEELRKSKEKVPIKLKKTKTKITDKEKINETIQKTKTLREEVLKKIDRQCFDMKNFKNISPQIEKAKKIVDEYTRDIEWTANALRNCADQESEVLNQLFSLSNYSRNEMNRDMAVTAEQIKKGTMDPARKHRSKRKRTQFT